MAAPPISQFTLYIGDLHPDTTPDDLHQAFSDPSFPLLSLKIVRDHYTGRPLGYGYLNFRSNEDADRCLSTMNYKMIRGRPCRLMMYIRDPSLRKSHVGNVFVKGLSKNLSAKELTDCFSPHGNIISAKVSLKRDTFESLGYGFVHFDTDEAAKAAIAYWDGKELEGQILHVEPYVPKEQRHPAEFTNVYVKNLPADFDEEKLNELFRPYGVITKSAVMRTPEGQSKGFGFTNFQTHEQAENAIAHLHDFQLGEAKLHVCRAQSRAQRDRELRDRYEQMRKERAEKYAKQNLYVKNIPDDLDDAKLIDLFSPYGTILSAKVMCDSKTNRSRGFGFVCYSTPDEAKNAVQQLHQKPVSSKPLYVALAQTREKRRHDRELRERFANQVMYPPMPMMYPPRQGVVPLMYSPMFLQQPQMSMAPPRRPNYQPPVRPPQAQPPSQPPRRQEPPRKMTPNVKNNPQSTALLQALTNAEGDVVKQKQLLGEQLYQRIFALIPQRAAKITGMLLEMEVAELLHLIDSPTELEEKVREAVQVLEEHERKGPAPS
jgi:polyadenylate-binding protein